jgi:hypothetical protein
MLIHPQNSYARHSKRRTGLRVAQSRAPAPHTKNPTRSCRLKCCVVLAVLSCSGGDDDMVLEGH